MKRPIIPLLFIATISIMLLSVFAFRRYLPYTGIDLTPKQPPAIVLAMDDVYLVGLGHQGKLWSAKAKNVTIGRNRSLTRLSNIHDGIIFDKGKIGLKVKAGAALYNSFSKDLRLSGGVDIHGQNGQAITASGADWNSSTQILRSMGKVKFQYGSNTINTDQLIVNLHNQQIEMWNVTMSFTVEDIVKGAQEGH